MRRSRAEAPAHMPDGGAARRPLRIIVVDDDRDLVTTLVELLRDEHYEVKGTYSSAGLRDTMRNFDADIVLLDITLPDRNGYDAARELRKRYGEKHPVLIALTAWNKSSDKMLAELAGFDHHVGKPYDPGALLALLKRVAGEISSAS